MPGVEYEMKGDSCVVDSMYIGVVYLVVETVWNLVVAGVRGVVYLVVETVWNLVVAGV